MPIALHTPDAADSLIKSFLCILLLIKCVVFYIKIVDDWIWPYYWHVYPPSAAISAPVIKLLSFDNKNETTLAISSGFAILLIG